MPSSPPAKAPAPEVFVCACEAWMLPACKGLPFFKEHEGRPYCVLHYPGRGKSARFGEELKRKLDAGDFDFRGAWFPDEVDFSKHTFAAPADFTSAVFKARADFNSSTFGADAIFSSATFHAGANFSNVTFGAKAHFDSAIFGARANFFYARFRAEANFFDALFGANVEFGSAAFGDYVRFGGDGTRAVFGADSSLNLQFARIEKADRLSFHTVRLYPHWFVNVNARRFEFINVTWNNINWTRRNVGTRREIESLRKIGIQSPHRLLGTACWNLAVNAEDNHRYEEASKFRYMAMEARRLESWQSWRDFASWSLGWLYWLASGYGERVRRAFVVLIGVLIFFSALYVALGFPDWRTNAPLEQPAAQAQRREPSAWPRLWGALLYSLGVMTLQKPEPRPATDAAQAVVMLETILGPVQAALLALAIRRKFMR